MARRPKARRGCLGLSVGGPYRRRACSTGGGLTLALGVPHAMTAVIILAFMTITTGAMHEDGLADCADGFWGGWDKARRLEIMKDSAIGTYGVVALLAVFSLRWLAITQLLTAGIAPWILCIPAVCSRSAMVAVMARLPNARDDGLSKSTGRPGGLQTGIAIFFGVIAAFFAPGGAAFAILLAALLSAASIAQIAKTKIGGQTGDVLGATQQFSEVTILIALAAIAS